MTTRSRPKAAERTATPPAKPGAPTSASAAIYQARQMLQLAHWAAGRFATYDRASVLAIAEAVAQVAHANAARYAEWAVKETGFGVIEHKVIKNEACSLGILQRYQDDDFVSPRVDEAAKILSLPRPAGVVLALAPSTNPISSVYFKVLLALLTRNAVVVSPHPMAKECCADATRLLAATAEKAGAPAGAIQVVDEPTVPLIEALMSDAATDVIVATGGTAVVRAAHRSGNPALGVGPGNVPALVDATADLAAAARMIADSKAFDNSVLCTNESVLIVQEPAAGKLLRELKSHHAVLLDDAARDQLRGYLFPDGRINAEAIGKDAAWIADRAGLRVPPRTRVLLAPIDLVVDEEPFAHEKLCPVLAVTRVQSAEQGIEAARAVVRLGGPGHSASIHSTDDSVIMRYAARVPVLRVTVNAGNSLGSAGFSTNLAPSMTLGTGYVGRSSVGENLEPRHLVNWTRVAYNADPDVPFGSFAGASPWERPATTVPAYPRASNQEGSNTGGERAVRAWSRPPGSGHEGADNGLADAVREQLRALIIAELEHLMKA
ncbi:MAG TPA: aldehyde dehydrogenase family protein [Streptosporangiaceae bacterium]|nr:aldehyde dehydrogenase family protein [Streptosporangiaceae bacterium]